MKGVVLLFVCVMLIVLFFENISSVVGDVTLMVCGVLYVLELFVCMNSVVVSVAVPVVSVVPVLSTVPVLSSIVMFAF